MRSNKNHNEMAIAFEGMPVLTGEAARCFVEEVDRVDSLPWKELPEGFYDDIDECINRSRKFVREHEELGFRSL